MAGWTETYRGTIYPWHCDHMGHMNVMYYIHFFDQAAGHLLSACGYKWAEMGEQRLGFVERRLTEEELLSWRQDWGRSSLHPLARARRVG